MSSWFANVTNSLKVIQKGVAQIMLDLTALKAAVQRETDVEQSAITLIKNLSSQLSTLIANSGPAINPSDLQTVVDQLNSNATSLAAAVVAGTPAIPAPPPPSGTGTTDTPPPPPPPPPPPTPTGTSGTPTA